MKITIFGGSGFVGRQLATELKKEYKIQTISLHNEAWQNHIDTDTKFYINLIGKAHDHENTASEHDYNYANIHLTQQIFTVFKNSKATLMIHISSLAAVEEFSSVKPLTEIAECRPLSYYGISKRKAEEWLLSQSLPENKKLIIIRPPMIHGPGDKGNLGLLYKIIAKGIPYPLAAFNNKRSFISITNFIFYIKKIMDKYTILPSGVYHISDNESLSTAELIKIMKEVLNKNVLEIAVPPFLIIGLAKLGDRLHLPLNTKRLKKMTSTLEISSDKINNVLEIEHLPETAKEGIINTIKSFQK